MCTYVGFSAYFGSVHSQGQLLVAHSEEVKGLLSFHTDSESRLRIHGWNLCKYWSLSTLDIISDSNLTPVG